MQRIHVLELCHCRCGAAAQVHAVRVGVCAGHVALDNGRVRKHANQPFKSREP